MNYKSIVLAFVFLASLSFAAVVTVNTVDITPTYLTKGTGSAVCWINVTTTSNTTLLGAWEFQVNGTLFNASSAFFTNDTRGAYASVNITSSSIKKGDNLSCNMTANSVLYTPTLELPVNLTPTDQAGYSIVTLVHQPAYLPSLSQSYVNINASDLEGEVLVTLNGEYVGAASHNGTNSWARNQSLPAEAFLLGANNISFSGTGTVTITDVSLESTWLDSSTKTGTGGSINYTINNFNTTVSQNVTFTATGVNKFNATAKFLDYDNDFNTTWVTVVNGSCDFVLASDVSPVNTVWYNCSVDSGKTATVTISQNDSSGYSVNTSGTYAGVAVCPGTMTTNQTLTGNCTLAAPGTGAFTISGQSYKTLDCAGFSIIGDNSTGSVAVDLLGSDHITVKNCIVTLFDRGIQVEQGTTLSTFQNNTIGSTLLSGMYFDNATFNTVTGGEIKDANTGTPGGTGWEAGIALDGASTDNTITGVYMHNDRQGAIWLFDGSSNTHIDENNINDNCGFIRQIRCDDSLYTTISNNNITNGTGMGIEMYDCDHATVTGNTITGNAYTGIALSGVDDGTFTSNVVSYNNGSGVSMVSSTFNVFTGLTATANQGWGIYVALGEDNEFDTVMLSGNEMGSIGLVNTLNNAFYSVTSTGYPGEFNIYLANATDNYFHGVTATSTTIPTIDIRDGSTLNAFTEVNATATGSQAVFINSASNSNQFVVCSLRGNSTYGAARVNGSQGNFFIQTNFTAAAGNNYNVYFGGHSNAGAVIVNVFRGGTSLLGFSADSDNNTVCLNDFNTTATYYVNDATAGGNHYTCNAPNMTAGNIYGDVLDGTVKIYGTTHASLWFGAYYIGNTGAGYPYSAATSTKVVGVTDTAPLTLNWGVTPVTPSVTTNLILALIAVVLGLVLIVLILSMEVTVANLVACLVIAIIVIQVIIPYLLTQP